MKHNFLKNEVSKIIFNDLELKDYISLIISEATGLDFEFLNNNLELDNTNINENINTKFSEVDAIYKTDYMYFNIEINTSKSDLLDSKNMRYICHLLLKQVPPGFKDKYKKVWQININDYDYYNKGEFIYKSSVMEENHNIKRNDLFSIIDINLAMLRNIDYNLIKEERQGSLKKLLYIFICNDENIRKELYKGDTIMEKVNSKLEFLTDEYGNLYYDAEEFRKAVNYELGTKDGIEKSKQEIAKKMLAKGKDIEEIIEFTELTIEDIDKLREETNN